VSPLTTIVIAAWAAGITAFLGGLLAHLEGSQETERKNEIIHTMIAVGGGILLSAVAFALVPEGMKTLSPQALTIAFCAGGVIVYFLDAKISRQSGSKAQFMAMLIDFIPEAIALGAVFGRSKKTGILLAFFIGAQNLPEGFNAFRELKSGHSSPRKSLIKLLLVSLLGPLAACGGYLFLSGHMLITAWIMSAAGGGILYLVFQDIAPQSRMRHHRSPALGAVLGFAIGMIGTQILG